LVTNPDLYEQFIEIMQEFDPDFISINAVDDEKTVGTKYVVLSKNHKEGLILNAYGDGMKKAMLLISAVIKAKDGILLLDEFETGIHISAMGKVFRLLLETAYKLNVQIFMTSHSLEAIESVLKCCPNMQDYIRMITLVRIDDEVKVRNVNAEKAIQLLDEYGLELR
jgi:AAA15 family ATPase/GTPase